MPKLMLVVGLVVLVCCATAIQAYNVPTLELLDGNSDFSGSQLALLRHALEVDGIVALTGITGLREARHECLVALGRCYQTGSLDATKTLTVTLADGTKRVTLALDELSGNAKQHFGCPDLDRGVQKLRELVDKASYLFANALDQAILVKEEQPLFVALDNSNRASYPNFLSVVEHGAHLDHFHVYEKQLPTLGVNGAATAGGPNDDETLEKHTDQGLFVAIVPSLTLKQGAQVTDVEDGFEVELGQNRGARRIVMPNRGDAVFFMLGDGIKSWINSKALNVPVRPAPHRLVISKQQHGLARVWFGRMFFPPKDAFVERQRTTFGQLRMQSVQQGAAQTHKDVSFGGCSSKRHALRDLTESACGANEIYCWMSCRSTAGLTCAPSQSIQCVNSATNQIWTQESQHCFDCSAQCWSGTTAAPVAGGAPTSPPAQSPPAGTSGGTASGASTSSVCNTRTYSTNMYMDGFTGVGPDVNCLVFLFKSWILDTPVKYAFGSLGSFAIGLAVEFIVLLRREAKRPRASRIRVARWCMPEARSERAQFALLGTLYSIQLVLAYFAMLLAMSFAAVIFAMVMLGLIAGHLAFNLRATQPGGNEACCAASDEMSVNGNAHNSNETPLVEKTATIVIQDAQCCGGNDNAQVTKPGGGLPSLV